jgi:pimeloyl-ACP methyl ester carboxylesterase
MGTGPAVVLLHGLGGNWQNWLQNVPALARAGHRVIAVDLPGFGRSQAPLEPITIASYADWLAGLLDVLAIERCAVIGNSMGGQIAAEFCLRHPRRVQRLVLVSAAGFWNDDISNAGMVRLIRRGEMLLSLWSQRVVAPSRRFMTRPRARRAMLSLWISHPERISAPLAMEITSGTGKPSFPDALTAVATSGVRPRLGEIDCPTLIIWGEADRVTPVRHAYGFHEAIADSRLEIYAETGHLSMVERAPEFNALVAEFLAR